MSIYIFSRPVHSGKTTELLKWCNKQTGATGILMPDIDGSRKILDLATTNIFDIECVDPVNTKELLTTIGRFHFYSKAFEKANAILLKAITKNPRWLVIDEAGKLELDGKGFYPAIINALQWHETHGDSHHLLITVRDSLCAAVAAFFNLHDHRVIDTLEELE